ncbi:MAG: hypothetical protein E7Z93_06665 [Cyanobacteria bacterium SIG32]|nr:hypothetical protein [Cyanobacteria bacterium SIG32]
MIINFLNNVNFSARKDNKPKSIRDARICLDHLMQTKAYQPTVAVDVADINGKVTMSVQSITSKNKAVLAKIERDEGYASRCLVKGTPGKVSSYLRSTSDMRIQEELKSLDRALKRAEREDAKSLTDF